MTNELMKHNYAKQGSGDLNGFFPIRRQFGSGWGERGRNRANPQAQAHESRVAEAFAFLADVISGSTPSWALKEAIMPTSPESTQIIRSNYPALYREGMSASDFPLLTGDILDRMLLARFNEVPAVWRQYIPVRSRPLRDFRTVRNIKVDGGNAFWDKLTEWDGLKYTSFSEAGYTYSPDLYGKGMRLSFQAIMDDDLSAFDDIPRVLGQGGRGTLARFATSLLFDGSGPHALLFTSHNIVGTNDVLDINSLGLAIEMILGFVDTEGQPVGANGLRLVYGPGLHITANNLINQLTVDVSAVGGTSAQTIRVNNYIVQGLVPVEDPYIPLVATTNGDTSWLLVQDPMVGRPIAEVGFLSGFEEPQLFRKASNTATIAGAVNQNMGDWQTMAQEFKGVNGYGGVRMEPLSGVGSNGSGS